ncbi:glycosyltransferase family 4 protein [Microbacterium sp. ABRD28]|uniref:glycosyltransferase family 4 protein n=1 Tax=Microbacterium sp. ABRD28 TaxID=2268461 RepID=UPI0013DD8EF1|nr:glycosyltransferase family 4 protein [Microbacterium sp. ABRD28]
MIATAVETTPFVARYAEDRKAKSLALIQHFETWAATEEFIFSAWRSVDERIVIAPWLEEKCRMAGVSSHLLPNALDPTAFPPGPPLKDRRHLVLSLLSPHDYKRPDVVVAALEALAQLRPGTEVVAFGQATESPVASDVVRYVPDPSPSELRSLYQTAQVYLCGSDAEGWHLPPAEATLSGAAVVSTDIGGVRASMADDALYAPPGDVDGLAHQVLRVMSDLDAAQRRVDRARDRLLSVTVENNARALLNVAGLRPTDLPTES